MKFVKVILVFLIIAYFVPALANLETEVVKIESIQLLKDKAAYINYLKEVDSLFNEQTKEQIEQAVVKISYPNEVKVSAISYLVDGLLIRGFLFEPKGDGPYPAIIYNRGGNRDFGSLTHSISSIGIQELATISSWGYVVIASQYRGAGGSEGEDHFGGEDVNDVLALPSVLKQIPSVDNQRLGLFGWSRGSMMSLIALKQGLKVKAIAIGGIVSDLKAGNAHRPTFDQMFAEMDTSYLKDKDKWLQSRSAMYWIEQIPSNIPMLILSGSSDWRTKADQAINLVKALDAKAHPIRFVMYEGGNHSLKSHHSEAFGQLKLWFDRFLRDGEDPPLIDTQPKDY